jgi:TRAP-type mannitol/chloroaromatic compound transport system substrate-binding protein
MKNIKRRDFLKKTALAAAASAATFPLNTPAVHAKKSHSWRMVATWPPGIPDRSDSQADTAKLRLASRFE